jgi:hypothetical protein
MDIACPYSVGYGCRMLTCLCKEVDDDLLEKEGEDRETWFEGYCNYCKDDIEYKEVALRFPCEQGGWLGCYCSIDCISRTFDISNVRRKALIASLETNLQMYPISLITYNDDDDDTDF